MRSLISSLAAVLFCLAAIVATNSASAGPLTRRGGEANSSANGQCANGQCDNGQCDNGQCSETECERGGKHRRPIDVNVDVSPTPIKVNVAPTPVNVNVPAPPPPPEKSAAKPELGTAAVALIGALVFGVALLGALAAGFHSRVTAAKKKT